MTIQDRIAALELELSELKKTAGKPARVTPPVMVKDEGPRIVLIEERSSFVRPTLSELHKLHDVVCNKYPQFRPRSSPSRFEDQEEQEYFEGFEWSFERLGFIGRSATPDTKHYASFWTSECQDWLRQFRPNHRGNIGAGFLAAVVAHNDICFTPGNEREGIVWSIGVTTFGGRHASDAWKRVLDGELLQPTPPPQRFAAPSPAQVLVR